MMPGSPSTPLHSTQRRIAFGIVGCIVAMTGGLGNALATVNLVDLQGTLGAYAPEIAWLPAAYVMTNVSVNILLVKFRQQFGLRVFTEAFLILYVLITLAHLFVNDLGSAIAVRAGHGIAGAALNTLGLYYMLQAFPQKHRVRGIVVGLGIAQLALPLARVFSTDLLQFGEWRGLYLFELGLALVALGCVLLLKLPPGDRNKAFEPLDFVTFGLFAPGVALLTAVLAQGRIAWWTQTEWLGWALAASVVLVTAAIAIEHLRARPLLNTRWLATGPMLRLALAIVLIRIVLSEQATGAVGFLQALGMGSEQMRTLFAIVLLGSAAGLATSALTINPANTWRPVLISLVLMMTGALMDAQASNLTRPAQMYVSQFLLAFGGTFFLGPMLVAGIGQVISHPRNLISFVVLFGMTQNLGGMLGSALLGTFQTMRQKFHSSVLTEHLTLLDPLVAARVQATADGYATTIADPAQRSALAVRALGNAATREANVLAYNDVFLLIAFIAFCTLVWIIASQAWARLRAAPAIPASPPSPAATEST